MTPNKSVFQGPSMKCLESCSSCYADDSAHNHHIIADDECDSYITCMNNAGELVITVRGTDSYTDIVHDINIWQTKCVDGPHSLASMNNQAACHSGFLSCFSNIYDDVLEWLNAEEQRTQFKQLTLTGHSLGGAVATLLAYHLAQSRLHTKQNMRVVTFGSPRVGNHAFRWQYNQIVPQHFRYSTVNDMISCVPMIGYHHVGHSIYLQDSTSPVSKYIGVPIPNLDAHKLIHYKLGLEQMFDYITPIPPSSEDGE